MTTNPSTSFDFKELTKSPLRLLVIGIVILCFLCSCCLLVGLFIRNSGNSSGFPSFFQSSNSIVEQLAKKSFQEWATSNQIPYKILDAKVISGDNDFLNVAVAGLIREKGIPFWVIVETTVEVRKIGNDWQPQSISGVNSSFSAQLLSASDAWSNKCLDTLMQDANHTPCIRLTNNGYFDWQWKDVRPVEYSKIGSSFMASSLGGYNFPVGSSIDLGSSTFWGKREEQFEGFIVFDGNYDNSFLIAVVP